MVLGQEPEIAQNGFLEVPKIKYSVQTEKWIARHTFEPFWQWFSAKSQIKAIDPIGPREKALKNSFSPTYFLRMSVAKSPFWVGPKKRRQKHLLARPLLQDVFSEITI